MLNMVLEQNRKRHENAMMRRPSVRTLPSTLDASCSTFFWKDPASGTAGGTVGQMQLVAPISH